MRLSKTLQYGLLFALYLCRSGRTTVESASEGMGVPFEFLTQIASKLRRYGVVKSVRGPHGGYELNGNPTVRDVFLALSTPVSLLGREELDNYRKGSTDHRALAAYVLNLNMALQPLLSRNVRNVAAELVANEMARLGRASPSAELN